jgi:hypothetical protein
VQPALCGLPLRLTPDEVTLGLERGVPARARVHGVCMCVYVCVYVCTHTCVCACVSLHGYTHTEGRCRRQRQPSGHLCLEGETADRLHLHPTPLQAGCACTPSAAPPCPPRQARPCPSPQSLLLHSRSQSRRATQRQRVPMAAMRAKPPPAQQPARAARLPLHGAAGRGANGTT